MDLQHLSNSEEAKALPRPRTESHQAELGWSTTERTLPGDDRRSETEDSDPNEPQYPEQYAAEQNLQDRAGIE
jgi:hypothetical protein